MLLRRRRPALADSEATGAGVAMAARVVVEEGRARFAVLDEAATAPAAGAGGGGRRSGEDEDELLLLLLLLLLLEEEEEGVATVAALRLRPAVTVGSGLEAAMATQISRFCPEVV
jgi:hypothetical protein